MPGLEPHLAAARLVRDAGGELVGRTRLQKIAFLMQLAGFGDDFSFEYHHYGPYSEDLAQAMEIAVALGPVKEEERVADWGGRYSIYTAATSADRVPESQTERASCSEAKQVERDRARACGDSGLPLRRRGHRQESCRRQSLARDASAQAEQSGRAGAWSARPRPMGSFAKQKRANLFPGCPPCNRRLRCSRSIRPIAPRPRPRWLDV